MKRPNFPKLRQQLRGNDKCIKYEYDVVFWGGRLRLARIAHAMQCEAWPPTRPPTPPNPTQPHPTPPAKAVTVRPFSLPINWGITRCIFVNSDISLNSLQGRFPSIMLLLHKYCEYTTHKNSCFANIYFKKVSWEHISLKM